MIIQEQIKKPVVPFGNGSIVYTPKDWIGREVIVTLQKKSFKEEILEILGPQLEHIQGIYIYGSYARNENDSDSDVDVLVISDKKFKIKKEKYEITVTTLENLKDRIEKNPPYFLIIKEAKPIVNNQLLEELKKIKINKQNIKWLLEETKSMLKINKEIIEIEDNNFNAVVHSLILRLRLIYMIECLLKNDIYTTKGFKEYAKKRGIIKIKKLQKIYKRKRDMKKVKEEVEKKEVEKLWNVVNNETKKKSKEIY